MLNYAEICKSMDKYSAKRESGVKKVAPIFINIISIVTITST